MTHDPNIEPTERELEILGVLWQRGPSSVREVHTELGADRDVVRTTTLRLMQIMHDKGLVKRDESGYRHVYRPASSREAVERRLVQSFTRRVFGGSAMNLVARVLDAGPTDPGELEQIRRMIEEASGNDSEA